MKTNAIAEQQLLAKLSGHTYNWSPFQYMEIMSHMDPELSWITQSSCEDFKNTNELIKTTGKYRIYELMNFVGKNISKTICERLQEFDCRKKSVDDLRAGDILWNSYNKFTGNKEQLKYMIQIIDEFSPYLINETIIYCRKS